MNFKDYLKATANDIDSFLKSYNEKQVSNISAISKKMEKLITVFADACEGGKRLRGTLVKLGYEFVASPTDEILKPALAYEIFQTAILAHDDIIDQSPIRRGKPSIYTELGGNHYGISQTICLGDIGLFLSNQLIVDTSFDEKAKNQAISSFIDTQYKTGVGELLDIELPYSEGKISIEDILAVYEYKTAYYTIIGPLFLGAILGNAGNDLLIKLKEFGKNLGIAFQIKDDILGVFGEENVIGKSITTDIEEGKITTLWHYAYESADNNQKQILDRIYGQENTSSEDLLKIRDVFTTTGALNKSNEMIEKYVTAARKEIPNMPISETHMNMLEELCELMINRKK